MTEETVTEFVEDMVVVDQTDLVNTILSLDCGSIKFPEDLDKEKEYPEIYSWKLISPWSVDIVKEGDMPYFQFNGQTWLGKTMTNCLTEWQWLKDYIKRRDEKRWNKKKQKIVGVECWKCKQEPFGARDSEIWCLMIQQNCGYCGQERGIVFKHIDTDE